MRESFLGTEQSNASVLCHEEHPKELYNREKNGRSPSARENDHANSRSSLHHEAHFPLQVTLPHLFPDALLLGRRPPNTPGPVAPLQWGPGTLFCRANRACDWIFARKRDHVQGFETREYFSQLGRLPNARRFRNRGQAKGPRGSLGQLLRHVRLHGSRDDKKLRSRIPYGLVEPGHSHVSSFWLYRLKIKTFLKQVYWPVIIL